MYTTNISAIIAGWGGAAAGWVAVGSTMLSNYTMPFFDPCGSCNQTLVFPVFYVLNCNNSPTAPFGMTVSYYVDGSGCPATSGTLTFLQTGGGSGYTVSPNQCNPFSVIGSASGFLTGLYLCAFSFASPVVTWSP